MLKPVIVHFTAQGVRKGRQLAKAMKGKSENREQLQTEANPVSIYLIFFFMKLITTLKLDIKKIPMHNVALINTCVGGFTKIMMLVSEKDQLMYSIFYFRAAIKERLFP